MRSTGEAGEPASKNDRKNRTKRRGEMPDEDRAAQKAGIMMASIYRELLLEIVRCGFPVLSRRVSLTKGKKLWLVWKAWLHE